MSVLTCVSHEALLCGLASLTEFTVSCVCVPWLGIDGNGQALQCMWLTLVCGAHNRS